QATSKAPRQLCADGTCADVRGAAGNQGNDARALAHAPQANVPGVDFSALLKQADRGRGVLRQIELAGRRPVSGRGPAAALVIYQGSDVLGFLQVVSTLVIRRSVHEDDSGNGLLRSGQQQGAGKSDLAVGKGDLRVAACWPRIQEFLVRVSVQRPG